MESCELPATNQIGTEKSAKNSSAEILSREEVSNHTNTNTNINTNSTTWKKVAEGLVECRKGFSLKMLPSSPPSSKFAPTSRSYSRTFSPMRHRSRSTRPGCIHLQIAMYLLSKTSPRRKLLVWANPSGSTFWPTRSIL